MPVNIIIFVLGIIAGIIATGIIVLIAMPKMMIITKQSKFDYETTIAKLEQSVKDAGWSHKGTTCISDDIKKRIGKDMGVRIGAVKLCKADYADEILRDHKARFVSCLMPCSVSVWEGDDGKVYVSKMNTGLMGKMFGGIIARVMGGKVSVDEEKMLNIILEN